MNRLIRSSVDGEILSPRDRVRAVGKSHPLNGGRIDCYLPAGSSISEILTEALSERPGAVLNRDFAVHIDGHPIPRENWHRVRVKKGATVTFTPRLGHGDMLKSVLGLVVAVGALIAAPYLAPGLVSALGGIGLTVSTGIATALATGGIILAGTLALNALFPVAPALDTTSTPLNSIRGANNQLGSVDTPVPVVLGKSLQSPFYAAKPYTEIIGNDQYLRMLFCLGYGPLAIDSLQIGATPLANYTDVEIEVRQGFPGDAPTTLYPGQVDEVDLAITLDNTVDPAGVQGGHGVWTSQFTSAQADAFSLDVTATQGVTATDGQGNPYPWQVQIATRYRLVGAVGWTAGPGMTFTRSYSPTRQGVYVAVARGQYEVAVMKVTGNGDPSHVQDIVVWSALRSFKSAPPLAFPKPLALIDMRIKATNQLNGALNTFNCICTSLVTGYSGAGNVWNANVASQNPADLYRWVLQGPANMRPRADSAVDFDSLQGWWNECTLQGWKYNGVVNASGGSVYGKLYEIAAAGRARPTFIDGKWGVIWDQPTSSIVQHFTPCNSWGLQGQHAYAQQPDGWRVQFINEANGYTQDERYVYDDGFDVTNATLFETISFPGVTDPNLVWRMGRFQIAQARLRPEKINLSVGWEQLICTSGDRVAVTHDVLLIGLASGRVKSVAGQVITFDETVTIVDGKTYAFRFRVPDDARSILRAVDPEPLGVALAEGDYNSLSLVGDLSLVKAGTLFGFGETNQDSAIYRVFSIAQQSDLVATLTLVDDAPAISLADQGAIPPYNPNITIPPDPFTLTVRDLRYLEVIDGQGASVRALVRLIWQVPRFGRITAFEIQSQDNDVGAPWGTVDTVPAPLTTVDIPLLSAGVWSFRVRCLFDDGTASAWASLTGLNLHGLTFAPGDVTNLHMAIVDGQTVLAWAIVADQRTLNYEIRKGTSWDVGLLVGNAVAQPPWPTTGDGTYHVRAYVLSPFGLRIYSVNDAEITIAGSIIARNIIVSKDEQATGWTGALDGGVIDGSFIRTDVAHAIATSWAAEVVAQLGLTGLHIAVYLSSTRVDIGQAAACRFWTEFEADGTLIGEDFLGQADVLGSGDALGASPTRFIQAFPIWHFAATGVDDVFAPADVFGPADVFTESGVAYDDWAAVATGTRVARYFRPGYVLITSDASTNATGTKFSWFVDVPDREDDYTDLAVPSAGLNITFYTGGYNATPAGGTSPLPFNGGPNGSTVPHVQSAIINPTDGDSINITNLTSAGCTVNVVNAGANVTRTGVNLLIRGY
jgi:sulfur carrier protein ThiS